MIAYDTLISQALEGDTPRKRYLNLVCLKSKLEAAEKALNAIARIDTPETSYMLRDGCNAEFGDEIARDALGELKDLDKEYYRKIETPEKG